MIFFVSDIRYVSVRNIYLQKANKVNKAAKVMTICLLNDQNTTYNFSSHIDLKLWKIDNIDTENTSGGIQRGNKLLL